MDMVIKLSVKKLNLYVNTLKYLKASQFYHRGFFQAKRRIVFKTDIWKKTFSRSIEKNIISINSLNTIEFSLINNLQSAEQKREIELEKKKLINREFNFLNSTVYFDGELGWHDTNLSQLWRYNLHYFDFFRRLIEVEVSSNDIQNYEMMKDYASDWIKNNQQMGLGDGWHPYTISLRLVNWIFAYSTFEKYLKNDKEFESIFIKSLLLQSEFLLRNREYDVVGNHLFENLKTLIICGMFFGNSDFGEKYKEIGERELIKQLKEQFLQDGGHFELSAMYHSILLKGLIELNHVYRKLGYSVPKDFLDTKDRASRFLKNIIHPDGEIPLFNDAAFGIADSPEYIFELLSNQIKSDSKVSVFDRLLKPQIDLIEPELTDSPNEFFYAKDSGYLKTSDQYIFSLIDIGKPCPEYLPAHAHADIFSYELSYKGKRFVVDTGTYEYAGSKRDYDRATQSHNTLTINRENQSQVWGSFRVAERANPTVHSLVKKEEYAEIQASHDGYQKQYGTRHYRKYIHIYNEAIIVLDFANSKEKIESFVHFHPSVEVLTVDDLIHLNGKSSFIKPINASVQFESSVYHPKFGVEEENKKLVLTPINPGVFGYVFSYGESEIGIDKENITLASKDKNLIFNLRMESK